MLASLRLKALSTKLGRGMSYDFYLVSLPLVLFVVMVMLMLVLAMMSYDVKGTQCALGRRRPRAFVLQWNALIAMVRRVSDMGQQASAFDLTPPQA